MRPEETWARVLRPFDLVSERADEAELFRTPRAQGGILHSPGGGAAFRPSERGEEAWLVLDGRLVVPAMQESLPYSLALWPRGAPRGFAEPGPEGCTVFVYRAPLDAPAERGAGAASVRLTDVDADGISGNAFRTLFETEELASALVSIAAGRRVDTGPESERVFVILSGTGLVFLGNETTLAFEAGEVVLVPEGEPARVWARGPEDVAMVVFQPQAAPAGRRTLASEVRRLREEVQAARGER